MDAFSYLSVLLSVIIGLSITQILQGYRMLLLGRSQVRLYLPTLIWSALLLVFSTQLWWASFGLAGHRDWTFGAFAMLLLQTVLLYMMCALVLPDMPTEEPLDLEAHYCRETTPFFVIALVMLAVSIAKDWTINGELPSTANLVFHAVFAGMTIIALGFRGRLVHLALALAMLVFIAAYIVLLFARLGES